MFHGCLPFHVMVTHANFQAKSILPEYTDWAITMA